MIGPVSCNGCWYSGHPHNEDCPEAMHNKYQSTSLEDSLEEIRKLKNSIANLEAKVSDLESRLYERREY
jgi:hypothetical protein